MVCWYVGSRGEGENRFFKIPLNDFPSCTAVLCINCAGVRKGMGYALCLRYGREKGGAFCVLPEFRSGGGGMEWEYVTYIV